jgi:Circularly permutated YpsA SLOG family
VLERVVSGGQTGVDRAALDAAMALGLACGGWCPRGRRAEDGPIPSRYPLRETPGAAYPERTAWNVRDSDATLVLSFGKPRGGTALTICLARKAGRPMLVVDLDTGVPGTTEVRAWLDRERVRALNVAGPRESEAPGVHALASRFLRTVFAPARE